MVHKPKPMPITDLKTRIKAVQDRLQVAADGDFGTRSAQAFEKLAALSVPASADRATHIKAIQKFLGCSQDGSVGPETLTRMEAYLDTSLPRRPKGSNMIVSRKGLEMLIGFEVSSRAQYNSRYKNPIWPGGASGVTIGIGYDLGYNTRSGITAAWNDKVPASDLNLLLTAQGKTGERGRAALAGTRSVVVSYEAALDVFYQTTLPVYAKATKSAFPGVEKLPPDAQAALLSLVYNRGAGLEGASRAEMRNIGPLVKSQDLKGIARQIRNMKRLWQGKGLPGLLARRDKEADLVEQAGFNILPEDMVVI